MKARSLTLAAIALACCCEAAQAQRIRIPRRHDKPPGPALSPQEAVEKMDVPDGFSVEVVASEPDLVNPVGMTFDDRGRIWVVESLEYPRRSPGKGRDRVKVLEDTDHDGRVDKTTVFARGLNIPSGIAVGYGGVWVANSPDILFFEDTDGDLQADRREVVVTGFGRTDTHELPNSFTWGPDGWLYGLNGVFNRSHVKYSQDNPNYAPDHPGWKFTCAMFRIHPRTREFEVFSRGTSNPWGIAFDERGSAFVSACVIDHLWHIAESGYYHRQAGAYPPFTWKLGSIVEHTHQKAAYCGLEYFDSPAYPEQYRDRLYMGNIHGNCVNTDVLERRGSTYFAKPKPDFLTANDAWFMPVDQRTGPDGSLYILDWYDRYHCYQDANRDPEGVDRLKGRIYRIRYKNTPRAPAFNLAEETDKELIDRLGNENIFFRRKAQRILAERNNPATRPKLRELVLNESASPEARRRALWALIGTGSLEAGFHRQLLGHTNPTFRAWGVRAAGNFGSVAPEIRQRISEMTDDVPDVQLQVAIAAWKIEELDALTLLMNVLEHGGGDRVLPHIVWENLHPLLDERGADFVRLAKDINWKQVPQGAEFVSRSVERLLAVEEQAIEPGARLVQGLLDPPDKAPEIAARCLRIISERIQSGELRGERVAALRTALKPSVSDILAGSPDDPLYVDASFLAVTWDDPSGIPAVRRILQSPSVAADRRIAALEALVSTGDDKLLEAVDALLANRQENSTDFRGRLIAALGRLDDPRVADTLLGHYEQLKPSLQPRVVELLTQRVPWSKRLLAAIGDDQVPASALNLNQVRKLLASGDEELAAQVRKQWGVVRDRRDPGRQRIIAEMKRFIRKHPGNPQAGKKVFNKVCAQCHKIYGEGEDVGPDLTSNGRNNYAQLLSNVFDPSLVIGAAYQAHTVLTVDGRVLTGLLVEETPQRVVLNVQGGKREVIAREDIARMKASEVSMMPEKLENQLKPEEIADLFAFLTLDNPPSHPEARRLPGVYEVVPRETNKPDEFPVIVAEAAPGFTTSASGERGVALLKEHRGRRAVVRTHPVDRETPCVLQGSFELPDDEPARLVVTVSHHQKGNWSLVIKANEETLLKRVVGPETANDGWAEFEVDLSRFAGKTVDIELHNAPNGWSWEYGYWGRVEVLTGSEATRAGRKTAADRPASGS